MGPNIQAPGKAELGLVAEPMAVAQARGWLSGIAAGHVEPSRIPDLAIVMTELVANAVRHGLSGGPLWLAATPKPQFLCVQVTDDGPGFVPRPGAMASDEHGGYGLFLVERLTRRWGMTRENQRTRVWFEFDYLAPSSSS